MLNSQTALLDVSQMSEADRLTVVVGTPSILLLENAGGSVAQVIIELWSVRPVTIMCGPGNNGGDGFLTARHLVDAGSSVRHALLETTCSNDAFYSSLERPAPQSGSIVR
jgi:hypothetical protein